VDDLRLAVKRRRVYDLHTVIRALALATLLVACAPAKPTTDSGAPPEDAAKADTSTPCVGDYDPCSASSKCCTTGFVCNPSTLVCQTACIPINGLCSDSSQCCSGICNGTCQ